MNPQIREILDSIPVVHLATINKQGTPWASVLHFAADDEYVYWFSADDAQHSQNIDRDPKVSLNVWNRGDELEGVYIQTKAELAPDRGDAIQAYQSKFSDLPGSVASQNAYRAALGNLDLAKTRDSLFYLDVDAPPTLPDVNLRIKKRDGEEVAFDHQKITNAVHKAMTETGHGDLFDATMIAGKVVMLIKNRSSKHRSDPYVPDVEEVQDLVEEVLMTSNFTDVAKAYILYRDRRMQERKRDLFKKRVNLKPYEYPELIEYKEAIRSSYWVHHEFNYTSDVQDFKVNTTPAERNAMKNAMLAIAQIEVSVKTFWGDIFKRLPKPEIGAVGFTFAESEVRHHDAYSHLLEILGLNEGFEKVIEVPAIKNRIRYLSLHSDFTGNVDDREYTKAILLFSLFIEHVSLFSQFLIIMAFNKFKNTFKGISNAIEATSKEEQIHGLFGIEIINLIRKEQPEWFDDEMEEEIYEACRFAYESEEKVIEWIYEAGDLDFIPKAVVKEFVKNRLNNSLKSIGYQPILPVNQASVAETDWFDDEVIGTKHGDFFVKRSTNYNKRGKSITADDLF